MILKYFRIEATNLANSTQGALIQVASKTLIIQSPGQSTFIFVFVNIISLTR
ncbi:hypothetical protein PPEP_a2428 [Pseudoalteromonas peptidolytica F12-50-A1]|uniref:Uncharacterized protein n=1 Tax=Pseudoalteromonas peptidolytica F12-50-A1 TaxID=1315280 RepID=A0A8I0MSU4_9GAMM|nr:hypothetical protein [Pseudoalteromonas peptidolytica F12-50-A1]